MFRIKLKYFLNQRIVVNRVAGIIIKELLKSDTECFTNQVYDFNGRICANNANSSACSVLFLIARF